MSENTSGFGSGNTEESAFARFTAGTDGQTDESAFAQFAAAAEDAAKEDAEEKGETFDAEQFKADLRLYVLQYDVNNAIADYTKDRRAAIETAVKRASKVLDSDSFTVKAPTIDGKEVVIGKINVQRTKPSTSVTHPNALFGWVQENRPELIETRRFVNPHLSPEDYAKAMDLLAEHFPEAVSTEEKLAANAVNVIVDDAQFHGDDVVIPGSETVDDATGELIEAKDEVIPGLRHSEGGDFVKFGLTHGGKGNPQQKAAMDLLLNNRILGTSVQEVIRSAQAQLETKK